MYQPRNYPSKILLTGEYTVLLGYPALAIPCSERYAEWKNTGSEIDKTLLNFYYFIVEHPELKNHFLLSEFFEFIQNGRYLESNIPYGYGLGSSGSFCAAILDRFSQLDKKDVHQVYILLKKMEDFFHGQSSGLDPMVSYYNCAIQICNGTISFPQINSQNILSNSKLQLVDSKLKRDTQELVARFKVSVKDDTYLSRLLKEIVPLNSSLIDNLLNNKSDLFTENWMNLSKVSLDLFHNMIPESFKGFWIAGIESKSYYCKLCGAGGGGLFLVKVVDEKQFGDQLRIYNYGIFK